MRLITRRIWRAFPELDRFSDEQCRVYVQRVRNNWRYHAVALPLGLSSLLLSMFAVVVMAISASQWMAGSFNRASGYVTVGVTFLLLLTAAFSVPYLTRDFVLRRFIARQIGQARCLGCEYSLLGQRVTDSRVRCPECGRVMTLSDLGLKSANDLIPPGETAGQELRSPQRHGGH